MKKEKLKKKIRNNTRGITLMALVVTIIVLLILAGVSIGLVFDSDGLFSKANDAATKYNQSKDEEIDYLGSVMNDIEKYNGIYEGGTSSGTTTIPSPTPIKQPTIELIYKFGTNNKDNGIETIKIEHDSENALIVTGQANFQFSINSTDDFKEVTLLGYSENGILLC